jgi:hypothetical protein
MIAATIDTAVTLGLGMGAYGGLFAFEWMRQRLVVARRNRIPYRILVGGVRGKTTVVRLLHAGLKAAGIATVGRVTGDAPLYLDASGQIAAWPRGQSPDIRELRDFLLDRRWTPEGIQAVVLENMAIRPELARVVSAEFVDPTHAVICGAGPDHLDVLPTDPNLRCAALLEGIPKGCKLLVPKSPHSDLLASTAIRLGLNVQPDIERLPECGWLGPAATPNSKLPEFNIPKGDDSQDIETSHDPYPNGDGCLVLSPLVAAAESLAITVMGVIRDIVQRTAPDRETLEAALERSRKAIAPLLRGFSGLRVYCINNDRYIVDALSANDPESTDALLAAIYDRFARGKCELGKSSLPDWGGLIYCHREDRPERLEAFLPLLRKYGPVVFAGRVPHKSVLEGISFTGFVSHKLAQRPISSPVPHRLDDGGDVGSNEMWSFIPPHCTMVAIGNTSGPGQELRRFLAKCGSAPC